MILEINGQEVDLPTNAAGLVKLQKSLAALSDLDTRTGEYSWSLTLPATRRNAGIFGVALLHPQALDKFAGSFAFRLRSGGEEWRGVFLLSSIRRGFTGSLSMESFGWARSLVGKTLNDLTTLRGLEGYDGTQLPYVLAMDCDSTDLQFPLVAWGNYFAAPYTRLDAEGQPEQVPVPAGNGLGPEPLAVDDYPPSVYYLSVLRAIFREAGYYLQGPVLQDADIRRWCITAAGGNGTYWPWGSILPARAARTTPEQHFSYFGHAEFKYTNTAGGFDELPQVQYFQLHTTERLSGSTRAMAPAGGEYTAPTEGVYSFGYEATLTDLVNVIDVDNTSGQPYSARFAPCVLALVVFRSGEGWEGADGGICTNGTGQFTPGQLRVLEPRLLNNPGNWNLQAGTFSAQVPGLYLEAGDTVRLLVFNRRVWSEIGDGIPAYYRKDFAFRATATLACTSFEGPTVLEPAKVLPPLGQAELVKDFLLKTNTVPVVDQARQTITLLSREAHTQAQGEPVPLDDCCDPETLEFLPVLDGAGSVRFTAAEPGEDALAAPDTVTITLPGTRTAAEKLLASVFAPVGSRFYALVSPGQVYTVPVLLPCVASQDALDTARSEVNGPEVSSAAPRVVRYLGPVSEIGYIGSMVPTIIPFLPGAVPWAQADYAGALAWARDTGAVAASYRGFLGEAARGHVARVSACLTPGQYAALSPGRRAYLLGAEYSVEKIENWDPENPGSACTLTLLRRV